MKAIDWLLHESSPRGDSVKAMKHLKIL